MCTPCGKEKDTHEAKLIRLIAIINVRPSFLISAIPGDRLTNSIPALLVPLFHQGSIVSSQRGSGILIHNGLPRLSLTKVHHSIPRICQPRRRFIYT